MLHHYKKEDEYCVSLRFKSINLDGDSIFDNKIPVVAGYWNFQSCVSEDIEEAFEDLIGEFNSFLVNYGIPASPISEEISKKELKSLFPNM